MSFDTVLIERDNLRDILDTVRAALGTPDGMDIRHHAAQVAGELARARVELAEVAPDAAKWDAVPWRVLWGAVYAGYSDDVAEVKAWINTHADWDRVNGRCKPQGVTNE